MRRALLPVLTVGLLLVGCLPRVVGAEPLRPVSDTPDAAQVVFSEAASVRDLELLILYAATVTVDHPAVTCVPYSSGFRCNTRPGVTLAGPVQLHVSIVPTGDEYVSVSAWYSVPGAPDRVDRLALPGTVRHAAQ